jgi:hypothetical protein
MPPEQRDSDLSFEGPHSLAYRSRRDAELSGGARKIAMADAGGQDAQRFEAGQGFAHESFKAELQMKVNNYRYESAVCRPRLSFLQAVPSPPRVPEAERNADTGFLDGEP